jgi:hypothetical protein
MMAANLTGQVRGIADVVTAVAQGDLKRKLSVDAKGEIAALADTVNEMIETVRSFQVPPTPRTCAWPPSLPSEPTSRATRVTSEAKEFS